MIDEIQLGGDRLVRAVKQLVDGDRSPGQFLLTGSTNFLTVPAISEYLAGRARIQRLAPFSEAELTPAAPTIESWFDMPPPARGAQRLERRDYLDLLCRGGYPEVVGLTGDPRVGWFESYVETVTQRDIAALADIRKVAAIPRLDSLVPPTAMASGALLESFVVNEIARQLGSTGATVDMSHQRDNHGREIDLVLERRDGATMAIAIKATSSPAPDQVRHIEWFRDKLDAVSPGAFRSGILLHTGHQSGMIGDRVHLAPISTLWVPTA